MEDLCALSHHGATVMQLGRKELQRLAKRHGIKANMSSEAIVDHLLELRAKRLRETEGEVGVEIEQHPQLPIDEPIASAGAALANPAPALALSPTTVHASSERVASLSVAAVPAIGRSDASLPEVVRHFPSSHTPALTCGERALDTSTPRADAGQRSLAHSSHAAARPAVENSSERRHAPATAGAQPTAERAAPSPGSAIKRKSPGFMAPLRRHSSVDSQHLKRASIGSMPRASGRCPGEQSEGERGKENAPIPGVEPALVKQILGEIVLSSHGVSWDDIAGLHEAKTTLREIVILPSLRPEIFTGLRAPPRGLLLFGPPGTGKTLLARAVAAEANATFFSISASTPTSKMFGDGEKLVRALFAVAAQKQPSVIFIDEIDSILTARSSSEHEASRRLKTEFLVQFDGVMSNAEQTRVLVMGATNRPQELDDAAIRRLTKRIYIPLPSEDARSALVRNMVLKQGRELPADSLAAVALMTDGYSGSDLANLCKEAAMGPVRELGSGIYDVDITSIRDISLQDFQSALRVIRPSVRTETLAQYEAWNEQLGVMG